MAYIGGKSRTCKEISKIIKEYVKDKEVKEYYEPFCGGLSVACEFVNEYIVNCSDYNEDLIYFWNEVKNGNFTEMPVVSEEYFDELKNSKELSLDKSFAMFWCTYLCVYKGKYMPNNYIKVKGRRIMRRYQSERFSGIKKKESKIKLINFECCEYKTVSNKVKDGKFIIYCDPPYINTIQAYKVKTFNSEEFWKTMKLWTDQGNYVFVSEKVCPIDHIVMHEKDLSISMSNKGKRMSDKLFLII